MKPNAKFIFVALSAIGAVSIILFRNSQAQSVQGRQDLPFALEANRLVNDNDSRIIVGHAYIVTPVLSHSFHAPKAGTVPVYRLTVGSATAVLPAPKAFGIASVGGRFAQEASSKRDVPVKVTYSKADATPVTFVVKEVSTWDQGFSARLALSNGSGSSYEPFDLTVNKRTNMATLSCLGTPLPGGGISYTLYNYRINEVEFLQNESNRSFFVTTTLSKDLGVVEVGQVLNALRWHGYDSVKFEGWIPISSKPLGAIASGAIKKLPAEPSEVFFEPK